MSQRYGSEFTQTLWTSLDHILLVYVGSAAEFALVEENHWLFYTNKLPSAPLDRLISTFAWNRKVMMATDENAESLAKQIRGFHHHVEQRRLHENGHPAISNQAFRAVGTMLIEYALRAETYLQHRTVTAAEKETYYQDQRGFFEAMGITGWESSYQEFQKNRQTEIRTTLQVNDCTAKLFAAYRKDLGVLRYFLLVHFMGWFVPDPIRRSLQLPKAWWFKPAYALYPFLHGTYLVKIIHAVLLPRRVRAGLQMP